MEVAVLVSALVIGGTGVLHIWVGWTALRIAAENARWVVVAETKFTKGIIRLLIAATATASFLVHPMGQIGKWVVFLVGFTAALELRREVKLRVLAAQALRIRDTEPPAAADPPLTA